ncbi:MAG: Asp-tRNA(Asn)/Glu-tRNA(Gln) amidotransferase subunit GatC [Simkaniaceae bacterium]|nr:Asp-tRNA(Asn)/Glu-tRNA(Gln) amidotransferase subunit GatC [Simkaniaceae bacterium]
MDESTINELTTLCRIRCTEDEKKQLLKNLQSIISQIDNLNQVETDHVNPCYQVYPFSKNVLAEDEVSDMLAREDYLKNAPDSVGGMVKTPEVIAF